MTNTYAAALRIIERTDKGANASHLARELGLSFGEADALAAEILENGDARRLDNGRMGRSFTAKAPAPGAVAEAPARTITRAELGGDPLWVEKGAGTHALLMDRDNGDTVWVETDAACAATYAATYGAERVAVIAAGHVTGHAADSAWCSCGWTGPARGATYADQETARLAAEDHVTAEVRALERTYDDAILALEAAHTVRDRLGRELDAARVALAEAITVHAAARAAYDAAAPRQTKRAEVRARRSENLEGNGTGMPDDTHPAIALARATGATSVTRTVERRNLDGTLEVLETATASRCPRCAKLNTVRVCAACGWHAAPLESGAR